MTEAGLSAVGDGRWRLSGVLDFTTVPDVWPDLARLLDDEDAVLLSLDRVGHANTAGLVMLIEALDQAAKNGCRLVFEDLPAELLDLARMSRCESLLGANPA